MYQLRLHFYFPLNLLNLAIGDKIDFSIPVVVLTYITFYIIEKQGVSVHWKKHIDYYLKKLNPIIIGIMILLMVAFLINRITFNKGMPLEEGLYFTAALIIFLVLMYKLSKERLEAELHKEYAEKYENLILEIRSRQHKIMNQMDAICSLDTLYENEAELHEKQKEELKNSPTELPKEEPVIVHLPVRHTTIHVVTQHPVFIQAIDSIMPDTLSNMMAQEQTIPDSVATDSISTIQKIETPHHDIADLFPDKSVIRPHNKQNWSIELAYAGGMGEQNTSRPYGFTGMQITDITSTSPSPVTFDNWNDYAAYLSELPDDGTSHTRSIVMNIALNNANQPGNDKILRNSHHSMPIRWSLAIRYRLNNRFGLESGLSYSRLTSDFEMGSNGNTINEQQTIHYLGIPVKGIYNIYNRKVWSLYGSLGVTTEIPFYSPLNTSYYLHGLLEATDKTTIRAPWQWSVGSGLGLQYNFTPNIGLFAEPSLQYYIPTGEQIETYRTEHPFTFSLPLGIRFTW